MFRKFSLIIFLAILLGAFLVLRPYIFASKETPTLQDRLPDADFMARARLLDLAKDISGMLYYYEVPYREFLSEEFILSQAKNYGLQLQNPSYLFANNDGSWGALIEITDTTKLSQGIDKLRHLFDVKDTLIANHHVIAFEKSDAYIHYDKDYLFFFYGSKPKKYIQRIADAKVDQVSSNWMSFLNQTKNFNQNLVIYSKWDKLKEMGVDQALSYPTFDSTHVSLHTFIMSKDTMPIRLKSIGTGLVEDRSGSKLANVHFDIKRLKEHPEHLLYQYLIEQGKKIGFPTAEFIKTWDGDLSFKQGGMVNVQEKYIESELDDDFNVTEVTKVRNVKVQGFALYYSVNENGTQFYQNLIKKGVLTEQEGKFYFLLSPPLRLIKTNYNHLYYSASTKPKTDLDSISQINWVHKGTQFQMRIDSINTFDFNSTIRIKMDKLLAPKNFK